MKEVELLVLLLAVIGIAGSLCQKLKIPLPILLVAVGMFISMLCKATPIRLEPDTVFFIFLPPLLYLDAFSTSWKDLRAVGDIVTLQAFGLVLVTVFGVAVLIHSVIPGMPWAAAFVFGAIVSPTDAVVAAAITKEVHLPKRVIDIIKGESLVNDATGLVAYQFAIAATTTGAFSAPEALGRFLFVGIGGVGVGLISGWLLSLLRTRLENRPVEIISSLLSPFVAYLTAEHLHVSGVLSVVTAGLLLGWRAPRMLSSLTRLQSQANWETIAYILNGFSFLLMGLQLRPILETVRSFPSGPLLIWTATAALAPIIIRFAWNFTVAPLYAMLRRRKLPDWKNVFILSWSGMRGIVSMAAALALPLSCSNGADFPYRDLIIYLTVVVITSTLLVQGIALPAIARYFGFSANFEDDTQSEREARLYLAREAVRSIDETIRQRNIDAEDAKIQDLINHYLEHAVDNFTAHSTNSANVEATVLLKGEAIKAQRRVLVDLRDQHQIGEELFRVLQHELDLQETQVSPKSD